MNGDRTRRTGFTLIELLVVISIITLLVTLLLPALAQSKNRTRILQCAANLRGQGTALYSYTLDNEGFGPQYKSDGSDCPNQEWGKYKWSSPIDWTIRLYGGRTMRGEWPNPPSFIPSYRFENPDRRKLNPYLPDWGPYHCPGDVGQRSTPGSSWFLWTGSSYRYNSNWYGTPLGSTAPVGHPVLYDRRYESMDYQSLQVMISDSDIQYAWSYFTWWSPPGPHLGQNYYHSSFPPTTVVSPGVFNYPPDCNVGFLDGRVQFLRLGPYEPGDMTSVNTENYILDPNFPPDSS